MDGLALARGPLNELAAPYGVKLSYLPLVIKVTPVFCAARAVENFNLTSPLNNISGPFPFAGGAPDS